MKVLENVFGYTWTNKLSTPNGHLTEYLSEQVQDPRNRYYLGLPRGEKISSRKYLKALYEIIDHSAAYFKIPAKEWNKEFQNYCYGEVKISVDGQFFEKVGDEAKMGQQVKGYGTALSSWNRGLVIDQSVLNNLPFTGLQIHREMARISRNDLATIPAVALTTWLVSCTALLILFSQPIILSVGIACAVAVFATNKFSQFCEREAERQGCEALISFATPQINPDCLPEEKAKLAVKLAAVEREILEMKHLVDADKHDLFLNVSFWESLWVICSGKESHFEKRVEILETQRSNAEAKWKELTGKAKLPRQH